MAQITVRDLALGYDSHVIADKLNFSVSSGDYLCIVGENGSGKTTLAESQRDRISSSADRRTEGFPGGGFGDRPVRVSESDGFSPVL